MKFLLFEAWVSHYLHKTGRFKLAKKLCFVVTDAISFNVLYRGQLEYLANSECELTLICGGSSEQLDTLRARNIGRVIDYGLVRSPSVWRDLLCLFKLAWHFLFNRYDVVVSTTPKALLLGSVAAFLTCQSRRVSFFQGRVYENFKGLKRKIYTLLDSIVVACSHEVIFVSKSLMTEFVKDIPSASKKGKVIGGGSGNGVCSDTFSPEVVSESKILMVRHELGIKDTDFVVLSAGRICEDKGINEIIEVANLVAKKVTNVRFIMLGNIEDYKAFERLSELRERGVVIHVDFVSDMTPYFALSDLHLFLSHREGFGNVAIEAAAMGVPTFAFDVVGVRDSVAEGVSGLRFRLGASASVANAILQFISTPEVMGITFEGSRDWAIKNFSKENVWKNYKLFYFDC